MSMKTVRVLHSLIQFCCHNNPNSLMACNYRYLVLICTWHVWGWELPAVSALHVISCQDYVALYRAEAEGRWVET